MESEHSRQSEHSQPLELDGQSLSLEDLARVARDPRVEVRIAPAALERVAHGWSLIEGIAQRYQEGYAAWREGGPPPAFDYGITTGFGEFKDKPVAAEDLVALQENILLSHAVGFGHNDDPSDLSNFFAPDVVRAALVVRLNAFLRGHSGIRPVMVEAVRAMVNRGVVVQVPIRGSVGSSGDLCPLAHLFVTLLGKGRFYVVEGPEQVESPQGLAVRPADELFDHLGIEPVTPSFKEGLSLTNGATFSAAMLALGVVDAEILANTADVTAALSLEAQCGCARALDPKIHTSRGHSGQVGSAANLRQLVAGSRLVESAGAVQDAYSLRCAPQVHGASRDTIAFCRRVASREINAATDNPLFFPDADGGSQPSFDFEFRGNWPSGYSGDQRSSYSAGNFHGQPLALAADFLAIALSELANVSERRTQMLLDGNHNRHLPANLVAKRGVNSGYMIAQYSAASMVSENKVLAHPASVDSIPTSGNVEDHVAMATCAARKLGSVAGLAQSVLAIELVVAAQALDWRLAQGVASSYEAMAAEGEASDSDIATFLARAEGEDRRFRDFLDATSVEERAAHLGRGSSAAFEAVRAVVSPLLEDRELSEELGRARRLVGYSAVSAGSELLQRVADRLEGGFEGLDYLEG